MHNTDSEITPPRPLYTNEQFDAFYPESIRNLSNRHWTPLHVAKKAAAFLAKGRNPRILDIGSGAGKFCLVGAQHRPKALFFGVEQRQSLISEAEKLRRALNIKNVSFIHENFSRLDFSQFDHFYFYNSFYENLRGTEKIDDSMEFSSDLYYYYSRYLFKKLEKMPTGTRVVTFHSLENEMPAGFQSIGLEENNLLNFWIRI